MNTTMNLQRIAVERLKPAKYNPRKDLKPGDPAYEKIKRSLKEFGYVDPQAVPRIAEALNLSRADVHGTISFYHDFRTAPPPRRVVNGWACCATRA